MRHSPWVALEATTDRRQRARELSLAHRRAMDGAVRDRCVREVIRESWGRSAAAGVRPDVRAAPLRFSDEETRDRLEHGPLALAVPVLRQLREDVEGEDGQIALLCDPEGTILWIEGDPHVLDRASSVHLKLGAQWSEDAVGTNAMGTALAVDHPVQIFSAEHFAEPVHEWTCAAAPLHDPDSGERIGVIDLSGGLGTAHPHSLALVSSAARMIEAMALRERREHDAWLRERFTGEVVGGRAQALVTRRGRIVDAAAPDWIGQLLDVPDGGGTLAWDGHEYVAQPVADGAGYLLVRTRRASAGVTRIEALGRDRAVLGLGSKQVTLSRRHSELLLTLSLRPGGMSAEELAVAVWGEDAKAVSARAELSRLRRILGARLEAGPYRLHGELRGDYDDVRRLVDEGRLGEALDHYPGPLLPRSDIPLVAEARQTLDDGVREALLARRDPALLDRWLHHPSGEDDVVTCRELVAMLPAGDARRPSALSHLRRITGAREHSAHPAH